jgi:BirA family biotin operon repressor/biotin-[acetyl-CoA-carboxylase] ligase
MNQMRLDSGMFDSQETIRAVRLRSVDSTNAYALRAFDTLDNLTWIMAEFQSEGRGRRGRVWRSPPGLNFYGSLVIRGDGFLPHALAWPGTLAALEVLREEAPECDFWLKWPNDIYCTSKKIAGVLCEARFDATNLLAGIVFGIGVNLNMTEAHFAGIDRPATSLLIETGRKIDVDVFSATLAERTVSLVRSAFSVGFENYFRLWKRENRLIGIHVDVEQDGAPSFGGVVEDVNREAELVVRCDDGIVRRLNSGDVRIRI